MKIRLFSFEVEVATRLMSGLRRILLGGLLLLLSNCTGLLGGKADIPERRKFNLVTHRLQLRLKDSKRPYPYDLQIKRFAVPYIYDRDRIVFRLSPYENKDDRWNVWAERPSQHVTDVIEQYLEGANLFSRISQVYLDDRPDYVLTGTVKAMERFDSGDLWFAHLAMTARLVDNKTNAVIWTEEFDETQRVYRPDMASTIEIMSQVLRTEVEKWIKDIDFKFMNKLRVEEGEEVLERELSNTNGVANVALEDTLERHGPDSDYELIPGKLAPEDD